jgi:hypothetical protein
MSHPLAVNLIVDQHTYNLVVKFDNGVTRIYSMKNLIDTHSVFKPIEDKIFFSSAQLDTRGHAVIWNDEIDIAIEEIYYNGKNLPEEL